MKEAVREERVEEFSLQSGCHFNCHLFFFTNQMLFSANYTSGVSSHDPIWSLCVQDLTV